MKELNIADRQEVGRWADNRVENSHQPFRRRERGMLRFRRMKTLQQFVTRSATSSAAKSTNSDAQPPWLSGGRELKPAWVWESCVQVETSCCSTDSTARSQQNAPDRICRHSTMWAVAARSLWGPGTLPAVPPRTAGLCASPHRSKTSRYFLAASPAGRPAREAQVARAIGLVRSEALRLSSRSMGRAILG